MSPSMQPINLAQFKTFAETYGSDIDRWPSEVQVSARHLASRPSRASILRAEADFDAVLDQWTMPPPSPLFRQQLAATAANSVRRSWATTRYWWAAIGLAAALSGAATGTAGTAIFVMPQHVAGDTIFGDVDDEGDN